MDYILMAITLVLIPLCGLLDHLGGQNNSVVNIPDGRITCRVFGIGLLFGAMTLVTLPDAVSVVFVFFGDEIKLYQILTAATMAALAIEVVPANGEEFNAEKGHTDSHGTNGYQWIYWICSKVLNIPIVGAITNAQSRNWGTLYGCILGLFQMPLFLVLAYFLTPWAIPLGLLGGIQGFIYRWTPEVLDAEWVKGCWKGARLAAVLIIAIASHAH